MYKPTILLIDNDADLLGASKDYLEFKGYNVLTADNAQDAKRYCQQEVVHLAVIDVRLKDDNDDDDWSGLRLAAELDQAIPKIILTGQQYADPADLVSRVLAPDSRGEIMAADFVWKRQGPDELLTKIQTAFQKRIKLNTNLRILFTNGLNWQALVEQITIFRDKSDEDKRKAEQVLEDLIQRLFHQASTVHLLRATPGKDSCTVMLARPIYDGIQGAYLIVKIGPHKRIEQEIKNYETWVAPYAGFRITHLQKGPVISREIGAIAYAVVGREIVDNTSLAQCFFENAGFIVETTGNVLKVSKPSSPEWQKYGEIIIKCLGEQSASRRDVLSLENSLSEISNNGGIGFLAHSAGLAQEARRQIWRVRKKGNSIIPLSIPYMRQMVEANDHQGCYRHLVSLNRTWSILSDPYESLDAISDPQWFVGRENLKEQIIDQIVRGNDVVVYGMRKSGKTVLLNQVALACRAKGFPTTIWFAKRDTGFETVLYNFIDGLIVSARSLYPDARLPSGGTLQEY